MPKKNRKLAINLSIMIHQKFSFELHDSYFYGQYWHTKKIKAVVVLVHGMGEHSSRYTDFVIPTLTENGFGVISFDQFGHGNTTGKRGHCPNFTALLESVSYIVSKAEVVFGEKKPIFLYGHSMGGNVAINYVLREEHFLKGIIATSPFLKLAFKPPAIKLFFGRILQSIAPSITMENGLDANDISRDPIEVQKYINDPLIHNQISPNYSLTIMKTGKWALENAASLKTPMLLLHGTGDKIIDYKGSQDFAQKSTFANLKLYEGGYHELHNDLCKEEVMNDVVNWIHSQL